MLCSRIEAQAAPAPPPPPPRPGAAGGTELSALVRESANQLRASSGVRPGHGSAFRPPPERSDPGALEVLTNGGLTLYANGVLYVAWNSLKRPRSRG